LVYYYTLYKMKKFTIKPVGLGLNHLEHEIRAAMIWNRLIDANQDPTDWFDPSQDEIRDCNYPLRTGSMISSGFINVKNGLFKLSDFTVNKIKTYLQI